jgi:hypothetical protein
MSQFDGSDPLTGGPTAKEMANTLHAKPSADPNRFKELITNSLVVVKVLYLGRARA